MAGASRAALRFFRRLPRTGDASSSSRALVTRLEAAAPADKPCKLVDEPRWDGRDRPRRDIQIHPPHVNLLDPELLGLGDERAECRLRPAVVDAPARGVGEIRALKES